ncbi:hypothetical protein K461DRAFT_298101 [Myriangium duriaei CBS 260.36]|uniref:Fungal-specific transcription factor domain-containing protein n=1 Tax=Myriangium duriaei CBS 260.36 TaxID=1168546 RepID=A0A9P4IT21_9PEZI|nr:hypothetical protein K461DRAFT_298101 [Myriangium duriaei CBS 260.36]
MARTLKTQIRENSHQRRGERSILASTVSGQTPTESGGTLIVFSQAPVVNVGPSPSPNQSSNAIRTPDHEQRFDGASSAPPPRIESPCALPIKTAFDSECLSRTDLNLITFYLEDLFPFLYPLYSPSALHGGRAWILDLLLRSPVIRQAMLCQSSYYLSLTQSTIESTISFDIVLAQTRDAFHILGQALSLIQTGGIANHIHGTVRIFTGIMQLQRFEVALSSFQNCRAHLNACASLFRQLLHVGRRSVDGSFCPSSCFDSVMHSLGPSSWTLLGSTYQVSSSEQDAFRFSSALLIFDDVIASTVLQEVPQLYDLHTSLLASEIAVDLQATIGCQNWVILYLGKIASLNSWKRDRKRAGSLDIVELVQRAMSIKASLKELLGQVQAKQVNTHSNSFIEVLGSTSGVANRAASKSLTTRIWAHAALLYLTIVVSGWQPANIEIRMHVQEVLHLLSQLAPLTHLRAACWPLCLAGCLAEVEKEAHFRTLVQQLQPPKAFGTLYRALDIMERAWQRREELVASEADLAAVFQCGGELILLV